MEKDLDNSVVHNSSCLNESETDKSFVGKVKSIINNTPLSKWFWKQDDGNRSSVRRRDEICDEDEEIREMQPPSKKVKLPVGNEGSNCNNVLFNETPNIPVANSITKPKFNNFHEPVAGPSGIKSRKLLGSGATTTAANSARNTFTSNELLNGLKDSDSEESTSGYSSVPRIGSKEQVCGSRESSKQTSPLQNSPSNSRSLFQTSNVSSGRSLFADRSLSPNMNTSLSSRRPSFNASTFGSPNFVDKTIATKKVINSPFYNGKTIYGGASAYGRSLGRSSRDLKMSMRNSVQIKPVNKSSEDGNLVLGKTARRILDTLEQYSTPINDAKKIPMVSKKPRQDGLLTKYTGANPYVVRDSKVPSNKELQVPSVPDLLKMKQRIRLQESTEIVKQIAASSKSNLNTEIYKISTDEKEKEKYTGKVKTKVTSVRSRPLNMETPSEINLTPVSLPITTLPKFDLNILPPAPPKKVLENVAKQTKTPSPLAQPPQRPVETEKNVQIEKRTTTTTVTEYKFSEPIVISENIRSIVPVNNFKFSEPICMKNPTDNSSNANFKMPENKLPALVPTKSKGGMGEPEKPTILKTGSVMDVLGKKDDPLMEKFKPAQGTWECSACMIRNQPEKSKCAACETPRSAPSKPAEFGSQYKMSPDKWECPSCLVRNDNSESKCVACSTPRTDTNSDSGISISSGFGDKFKPSTDSWECPTCMIRNNKDLSKCVACETANPKPAAKPDFDNKFKPAPNSWECSTCLVRNKEDAGKCIACETPKSGAKAGFGDAFKPKVDEWECAVCMVRNKMSNIKCQCCDASKPGGVSKPNLDVANDKKPIASFNFGIDKASATSFSFGVPPAASASTGETNAPSVFGGDAKSTAAAPATFSFGIPATVQKKPETAKPPAAAAAPALATSNPLLKPTEKLPEKTEALAGGFKFESPKPIAPVNKDKPANVGKTSTTASVFTSIPSASNVTFSFKPAAANGDINKTALFGKKTESSTNATFSSPPNANIFSFGAKPAAAAAPLPATPATQSSQSVSDKPVFKFGPSNHLGSETPAPSFGSAITTAATNGFVTTNTPSFGTSTPSFGAPVTKSETVKPFSFTAPAPATGEPPSKASLFSFGQASGATAPAKAPGFNFGTANTPTFNFSGAKAETPTFNPPATNNVFGAAAPAAGKNGTFNFGSMASNNNNQKAGFSFGAAVNSSAPAAPAAQSGFSFGAAAAAANPAPSAGGFNFTGAPATFNANAKPSFNFTDGNVTTFSAQPTTDGGLVAPRKIKRAVRRTQR